MAQRPTRNNGDDHFTEDISVPKTLTPWIGILLGWVIVFGAIWWVGSELLFRFFEIENDWRWAGIATLALFAAMITSGTLVSDVSDWEGILVFNPFTKNRRVMFPGFHPKHWWERLELPARSLKREVSATVKAALATNDPAERMDVEILIHARMDTRPNPPERDAENFKRFMSIEDEDLKHLLEAQTLTMFGEYYGNQEMENLLKLREVQDAVLAIPDNHHARHRLESQYGIHIGTELKRSEPDAITRALKSTPARAEGLRDAIQNLVDNGMDLDKARRAALLLDDTAEYSATEFDIELNAHGLENLRDVTLVPPGGIGGGGTKAKKDGGKK